MADTVTIRHPGTREERVVHKNAVPYFTNHGFEVVKQTAQSAERQSKATSHTEKKES